MDKIKNINSHLNKCIQILDDFIEFDKEMCNKYKVFGDLHCFFGLREHSWYWFLVNLENIWEALDLHKLSNSNKNKYKVVLDQLINELDNDEKQNHVRTKNSNDWQLIRNWRIFNYIFDIIKHNIFFYLNLGLIMKKHWIQLVDKGYIYKINGEWFYWFFILIKIRDYFFSGNCDFIDNMYSSKEFMWDEEKVTSFDIDIKNGSTNPFVFKMCEVIFWPEPREYFRCLYGQKVISDINNETIEHRMIKLKEFLKWLKDKINNDYSYIEENKFELFKLFLEESKIFPNFLV